ncbi:N-methyl-L-tryptophan oxidase-like [Sitodiplosis mosellana]|uniref:N-methyl-L-tryptophan oxidase-like n=1 Tax=Sitodiplosis mosellana TaxID=263140 RepID=UPI0024452C3A|nr:N-methyl-L-tryptophan oxidase-like [Sitodiplosis mosellana]XP_055304445.1 N-methyl-L-tryptophan oxidase-like [Sitodiplosis mosellana]
MIYDLIVVGSGSVGSAAGYYAAKAGLKVLMIDNGHPPHDQGSHHGETRLMRHAYGQGEIYVPMVLRAQQLWDELEEQVGERIMHRCGVINIGPNDSEYIRNANESASRYQIPVEMLTAEAVMKRWPQIKVPHGFVGVFEPNAGYLKSEVAIGHFIRLAKEAGCTQLFNCPTTGVTRDGDVQKVETANGVYFGRKLVFSAGTWLTKLLPKLPVQPVRKVFGWYQADDSYNENNKFPGFVFVIKDNESEFYGFPANNNALKVGKHSGGQPINSPEERTPFGAFPEDNGELLDFLHSVFPGTRECIYGKSCTYDMSPDKHFIIHTQPDQLIISGLSGHAFKFASVLGEIAAAFAQNKSSPFDLSPFSLSRFAKPC